MSILSRLAGLETEYAFRLSGGAAQTSRFHLYRSLVRAVERRVVAVEAKHFKEGVFTANGGAIWYEVERPAAGGGMVEGSTPECRRPLELLIYQRAQDRLLSEAAQSGTSRFSLLKNDRDAEDNVYGSQENYECQIASGWRLAFWRMGLIALTPLVALWWISFAVLFVTMLSYHLLACLTYLLLLPFVRQPERIAYALFGGDIVEGCETGQPAPRWLEDILLTLTRVLTAPVSIALWMLAGFTAFTRMRRELLPFLLSRAVYGGAGHLDAEGCFQLADKAPAINCRLGLGRFIEDRPIFILGHFLKALYAETPFPPRAFFRLFSAQQRLQIGLGDSNMADVSEYLRIGATMLVIDAIEAGELTPPPHIKRPIQSLHDFCRDDTLTATAVDHDGRAWTAIELQRFYLEACRKFVSARPDAPGEAWDILERWEQALDGLEQYRDLGEPPHELIGSIDWLTKKWLMDRAGEASWIEKKKIDLRYHELTEEGYFRKLQAAGLTSQIVEEEEIERAIRTAPANSPATTRGQYIREFSQGPERVTANWNAVVIGVGRRARVIRLARYGQGKLGTSHDEKSTHRRANDAGAADGS